eukprot:Selendium_serpulae@DN5980_c1_g1_i6.p2
MFLYFFSFLPAASDGSVGPPCCVSEGFKARDQVRGDRNGDGPPFHTGIPCRNGAGRRRLPPSDLPERRLEAFGVGLGGCPGVPAAAMSAHTTDKLTDQRTMTH